MSADNVTSPPGRSGPARSRPALIPIVDPNIDPDQIAAQAPTAVRSVGFIVGIGHRLAASADWLRAAVADFVELPLERRLQHLATAANDWLGYAPPASEALAASQGRTRPGDLRQTWTWRPGDAASATHGRTRAPTCGRPRTRSRPPRWSCSTLGYC